MKKNKFKKILFYISMSCWIIYFLSGIYAFFLGYDIGGLLETKIGYGMLAMKNALLWNLISFSIIPILPISLLYIIIYSIVNKRKTNIEIGENNKKDNSENV